jgi:hypothetical protein
LHRSGWLRGGVGGERGMDYSSPSLSPDQINRYTFIASRSAIPCLIDWPTPWIASDVSPIASDTWGAERLASSRAEQQTSQARGIAAIEAPGAPGPALCQPCKGTLFRHSKSQAPLSPLALLQPRAWDQDQPMQPQQPHSSLLLGPSPPPQRPRPQQPHAALRWAPTAAYGCITPSCTCTSSGAAESLTGTPYCAWTGRTGRTRFS